MAEVTPPNPSEGLRPADILTANYWDGVALFNGEPQPFAVTGTHFLARFSARVMLSRYVRDGRPPVALETFVDGEWDVQQYSPGTVVALHTESLVALSPHDGNALQEAIADVEPPERPLVGRPGRSYAMPEIDATYANHVSLGVAVTGTDGRVLYETPEVATTEGKRRHVRKDMIMPMPGRFTISEAVLYAPQGAVAQLILRRNRVDILKYGIAEPPEHGHGTDGRRPDFRHF